MACCASKSCRLFKDIDYDNRQVNENDTRRGNQDEGVILQGLDFSLNLGLESKVWSLLNSMTSNMI